MKDSHSSIVARAFATVVLIGGFSLVANAAEQPRTTIEFKQGRVAAPSGEPVAGEELTFVNRDVVPHEAYSPDCRDLSSPLLQPGAQYTARVPSNVTSCEIQDLLNVGDPAYTETVQIEPAANEDWVPGGGG